MSNRSLPAVLVLAAGLTAGLVTMPVAAEPASSEVKWPPCKCVNYGRFMLVGEVGCIRTNKGPRMARCILKGNVTYWEWLDDSCPVSKATPIEIPARVS